MKKPCLSACLIIIALIAAQAVFFGQNQTVPTLLKLAPPDLASGGSLMQALKDRCSVRSFADTKLTPQQLAGLLWAANGVNRDDGKRTAPAALNKQVVDIYVVLADGVYLYDAVDHQLLPVAQGDHRAKAGRQDFVAGAPVNLVFVADLAKLKDLPPFAAGLPDAEKLKWAYIAAGCQAENVHLYCAAQGLGAVIRGLVDPAVFGPVIGLRPEQTIIMAQTVGVPK
ncbi:MAG: SagB/ThcOx family dehydrogenase [Planctomycetota bacterium]